MTVLVDLFAGIIGLLGVVMMGVAIVIGIELYHEMKTWAVRPKYKDRLFQLPPPMILFGLGALVAFQGLVWFWAAV